MNNNLSLEDFFQLINENNKSYFSSEEILEKIQLNLNVDDLKQYRKGQMSIEVLFEKYKSPSIIAIDASIPDATDSSNLIQVTTSSKQSECNCYRCESLRNP